MEDIKTQCFGSTSILLLRKDWNSINHDQTLSFFTKHSQLVVFRKLFGWKLEKSYTRKFMRHLVLFQRSPWNMSGWENWVQKLLNEQQTQITIERGRPVVCRDANRERSKLNEVDIDFRIPGLPHSVVKQAENSRVRELVKKIENHPHRQSLQRDLQQNNAYNPFSENYKKMIKDMVVGTNTENVPEGSQTRSCHESISFNVGDETIRDRTVQPVVNHDESSHEQTMLNEVNMDFRIPGLPHSVVKHAESSRVRELVKKIREPPRSTCSSTRSTTKQSLQPVQYDVKENDFRTRGNVELFELFETDPKTQCKECQSYWSEGIVYCTCGHLLKEIAAKRGVIKCTMDLLSIQEYVIKKERPHGHRIGRTPEKKEYHLAQNLRKRCIKRGFQRDSRSFLARSWFSYSHARTWSRWRSFY